jgi:ribose transport system ATP-binding protein
MLEIRSVSKSFPGVQALRDVSFDVATGEVHALMGENGAGKSTLMKILSGVYQPDAGAISWEGAPLHLPDTRAAQRRGIAIIHQELNLVPELTVAENIFLGNEPRTALGLLDRAGMEQEARALLDRLRLAVPADRPVYRLRVGEQQLVEIAKALSLHARLLILDEPTSALSTNEIERLFGVIDALQNEGVTMIYISHKLDEIFRVADGITVLRDGQYVGTRRAGETDEAELIRMMVGRPLGELFPESAPPGENAEALRVEGLGLRSGEQTGGPNVGGERALDDISFTLRRGEIVGVAGLMGAGRTELLETLFGVHDPDRVRGRVFVNGRERRIRSPREALGAGLALVTEDRKNKSLVLPLSVGYNTTLAALGRFVSRGLLQPAREDAAVREQMGRLRIKASGPATPVETLSGGNQQKVVLAKCLLTGPNVLLLDEPTRGIDVGAKAEIYALIRQLAAGGTAILMASSELPEILALSDRILVLSEGRLTAELARAEATQERILEAATPRRQPQDSPAANANPGFQ